MSDPGAAPAAKATWRFPRYFWSANVAELFERAAYYGVFIALAVYLTRTFEFSDPEAGWIVGVFYMALYLLPPFAGALADRIGFRYALALAFTLLGVGYGLLGGFGTPFAHELLGITGQKFGAILALFVILLGGSIVKPVVSGTVAKASNVATRARAFSIFYQIVNIGAFLGKTFAHPLRTELGLEYIAFYSAIMGFLGAAVVLLFYRGVDRARLPDEKPRSMREIAEGFGRVLRNGRFLALILIVAGFWIIQGQLYASMPKYVLRTVGEHANPEWLANVNPLVVVIFVVPITHLVRKLEAVTSIGISLAIIPFTALVIASSPLLTNWFGYSIEIFGIAFHPITICLILGIALQGFSECFLSPRFLEYASRQAPPGEEGLYMGYSHLHSVFSNIAGFVMSGYLLDAYVPEPETLPPAAYEAWQRAIETGTELPPQYQDAHVLWIVFAAIGAFAFLALLVFQQVTKRADRKRAREAEEEARKRAREAGAEGGTA